MKFSEAGWVSAAVTVNMTKATGRGTKRLTMKGITPIKEKREQIRVRVEEAQAVLIRERQVQLMVGVYNSPMVMFMSPAERKGVERYKALHLKSLSSEFPAEKAMFEQKALDIFFSMVGPELRAQYKYAA